MLILNAVAFSKVRGQADSKFNNRSHRKIAVIDGVIGYTGGVNIADEYVNAIERFWHWKDGGIRLEGDAVCELTRLFLTDFAINVKNFEVVQSVVYPKTDSSGDGFIIPFGDGPRPIYRYNVSKLAIQNMLSCALDYAYIFTPYLIIDNELCKTIETTALRGVKVKIVVPHVADKRLIFSITRSFYRRLMEAGVEIYEYTPGFIHAKAYLVDGEFAIVGTVNLDYRSLVHHFENGVWMYRTECIKDIVSDMENTIEQSEKVGENTQKPSIFEKLVRCVVRIFSPLL